MGGKSVNRMPMNKRLSEETTKRQAIIEAQVVPDTSRCVQCGICSYYCPIGIDVRRHAWLDIPVLDSHCLTCGECIARCPRSVLRLDKNILFTASIEVMNKLHDKDLQKAGENV